MPLVRVGTFTAILAFVTSLFFSSSPLSAQEVTPPADFRAEDFPNDAGGKILLTWKRMPYDAKPVEYILYVSDNADGPFEKEAARTPSEDIPFESSFKSQADLPFWAWDKDRNLHYLGVEVIKYYPPEHQKELSEVVAEIAKLKAKKVPQSEIDTLETKERELKHRVEEETSANKARTYYFKLVAQAEGNKAESPVISAIGTGDYFDLPKVNNFILMIVFSGIILLMMSIAKKKDLYLRRIPGLDAIEEAIGRATEMGRPIYYLTGRDSISSISTIASTTILGEVAKKIASYDSQLRVPHTDPMTMVVCQEIVKQSYTEAGRPDAYREDINFFLTDDQFGYTAAVDGLMVREKPAACFFMGYFYAEALLLAETGAGVGAIQVAGTDADAQLPFFVAACDYTLIGEELFAASAYLSRAPVAVGTLRGQDIGKIFLLLVIISGVTILTIGTMGDWLPETLGYFFDPFKIF